eukprot:260939-Lingulodinium_polyedra.AAC.1
MAIQSGLTLACVRCVGQKHGVEYLNDQNQHINGWKKRSQRSKGYVPQARLALQLAVVERKAGPSFS